MTKFTLTIVSTAAACFAASSALAAGPAAGEYPQFKLFDASQGAGSMARRADVEAGAMRHMPASGEMSLPAMMPMHSRLTRVQVRRATRDALAHGATLKTGEMS